MLKECPISCGICSATECKDKKFQCDSWARANACNENPEFMSRYCPKACEICRSTCVDLEPDCPGWTADGECYKNPGFLFKNCPKSCGVCAEPADGATKTAPCSDFNTTQCAAAAATKPLRLPAC